MVVRHTTLRKRRQHRNRATRIQRGGDISEAFMTFMNNQYRFDPNLFKYLLAKQFYLRNDNKDVYFWDVDDIKAATILRDLDINGAFLVRKSSSNTNNLVIVIYRKINIPPPDYYIQEIKMTKQMELEWDLSAFNTGEYIKPYIKLYPIMSNVIPPAVPFSLNDKTKIATYKNFIAENVKTDQDYTELLKNISAASDPPVIYAVPFFDPATDAPPQLPPPRRTGATTDAPPPRAAAQNLEEELRRATTTAPSGTESAYNVLNEGKIVYLKSPPTTNSVYNTFQRFTSKGGKKKHTRRRRRSSRQHRSRRN